MLAALGVVLLVVLPALLLAHDSPALAGLAVVATVVVALARPTPRFAGRRPEVGDATGAAER